MRETVVKDSAAWDRYEVWNRALSHVVFNVANAGHPVYLDMDDDILGRAAAEAGVEPSQANGQLVSAVRDTLNLGSGHGPVFAQHIGRLSAWRQSVKNVTSEVCELQPPPVLALLGVLTLAAEGMGRDADFGANAYYPRLFQLLSIDDPGQRRRLQSAYMHDAEGLWRGLNEWLAAVDGQFGLPSAYALSHRYVGLPVSQALVRAADRQRFPHMFSRYGLPPGAEVSPTDMVRMLDSWIQRVPCPVSKSLESLWQRGKARDRIASVAAVELLSWDGSAGTLEEDDGHVPRKVLLLCQLRRFPRPRLEISFVADLKPLPCPDSLVVLSAEGTPAIDVVPVIGARVQPAWTVNIDPRSLVEGVLRLSEVVSGHVVARWPRRVVPLRRDELLNSYVECERVQLGEDAMLLVKDDRELPQSVHSLLEQIARPGFREEKELPGLPVGWVLYSDVQIMASPASEPGSDLNVLVPILSSQLTLAGGLKLPGRMRKWSSLDPPEVRAVVQDSDSLTIMMSPLDGTDESSAWPTTWTSQDPTLVVDLATLHLSDGDYELSLMDKGKILQQTTLRLRSSNTPDTFSWQTATALAHDLSNDPLAGIRALPLSEPPPQLFVRGPYTSAEGHARFPKVTAPKSVDWNEARPIPTAAAPLIVVARPEPTSCVVTGAHRIMLPTFYGQPTSAMVSGVCGLCGLVKRFPACYSSSRFAQWSGSRSRGGIGVAHIGHLPEVQHRDADWNIAFDSLVHIGGGLPGALERVALQVEGTKLFVDEFSRGLEARGDLEIQRASDLIPEEWELCPAYVAELADGAFILTGRWTGAGRQKLRDLVLQAGGAVQMSQGGMRDTLIEGVDPDELEKIAACAGSVGLARRAASRLLDVLPPLSELEAALPRVPMPGARRILKFHVPSASWNPTPSAADAGAYRLESAFATINVFRNATDVSRGEAVLGTVQLIKHIAAYHSGRILLAYNDSDKALAVPLGADLPVLYGRTAVLCSGRLPTPVPDKRQLIYHDVPQTIADGLAGLFTA